MTTISSVKNSDEILCFLTRNSKREVYFPLDGLDIQDDFGNKKPLDKERRLYDLLLRLSGKTQYKVPFEDFEAFLGEPYSFEKHLRPLYEDGTLYFVGIPKPDSIYDSPSYRKIFDPTWGLVCDYSQPERPKYVRFTIGEDDFLSRFGEILKNAEELGLFGEEGADNRPAGGSC